MLQTELFFGPWWVLAFSRDQYDVTWLCHIFAWVHLQASPPFAKTNFSHRCSTVCCPSYSHWSCKIIRLNKIYLHFESSISLYSYFRNSTKTHIHTIITFLLWEVSFILKLKNEILARFLISKKRRMRQPWFRFMSLFYHMKHFDKKKKTC